MDELNSTVSVKKELNKFDIKIDDRYNELLLVIDNICKGKDKESNHIDSNDNIENFGFDMVIVAW